MRLWVKAECLQQGGSFKLRGATNRLLLLERGGAGARRGRFLLGQPCPGRGARGAAARHRGDDRHARRRARGEDRRRRAPPAPRSSSTTAPPRAARRSARAWPPSSGATLVPSFDDVDVIEGQGSVGVEIARAARRRAADGARPLRRRRPVRRDRAGACRSRGSSRSSRRAGTTWPARSRSAGSCRSRSRRRRPAATRSRPNWSRR